jgi:hypothetical protein
MVDMLSDGKWKLSQHGRGIMRYGYGGVLQKWLEDAEAQPPKPQTRLKDLK